MFDNENHLKLHKKNHKIVDKNVLIVSKNTLTSSNILENTQIENPDEVALKTTSESNRKFTVI